MNILAYKKIFLTISSVLVVASIIFLSTWGLRLGIDFTGGVLLQLKFPEAKTFKIDEARAIIEKLKIKDVVLQVAGENNLIIKTGVLEQKEVDKIKEKLAEKFGQPEEVRYENIGPIIGKELAKKALWAVILASIGIIVYIAYAFGRVPKPASSWRFGICAVIALIHDVLITIGVFSVLSHFGKVEIDGYFITALLTIMGFSVHDTIVVFDRIRENLLRFSKLSFTQVINESITQTITRSINTSLTVLLVLSGLYLLGGVSIKNFALALLIGIVAGTYSSIFIASPLLIIWQNIIEKRKT
jgi:preprotein translocase subunit SecF